MFAPTADNDTIDAAAINPIIRTYSVIVEPLIFFAFMVFMAWSPTQRNSFILIEILQLGCQTELLTRIFGYISELKKH